MFYCPFLFAPSHRLCLWGVTVGESSLEAQLVYYSHNLPPVISVGTPTKKSLLTLIIPQDIRDNSVGGKATKIIFEVKQSV